MSEDMWVQMLRAVYLLELLNQFQWFDIWSSCIIEKQIRSDPVGHHVQEPPFFVFLQHSAKLRLNIYVADRMSGFWSGKAVLVLPRLRNMNIFFINIIPRQSSCFSNSASCECQELADIICHASLKLIQNGCQLIGFQIFLIWISFLFLNFESFEAHLIHITELVRPLKKAV